MGNSSSDEDSGDENAPVRKMSIQAQGQEELNRVARKFDESEMALIGAMFRDLAARSPGKTMDKATFLAFFNFPGLMGERLFAVFDVSNTGRLELQHFVRGLSIFWRGSMDDKIRLLFTMYDLSGEGSVTPEELSTMLLSLVAPANHFFSLDLDEGVAPVDDLERTLSKQASVQRVVDRVFSEGSMKVPGRMSYEEFRQFAEDNSFVLEALDNMVAKWWEDPRASHTMKQELRKMTDAPGAEAAPGTTVSTCTMCGWQYLHCFLCGTKLVQASVKRGIHCIRCGDMSSSAGSGIKLAFCMNCGVPLEDMEALPHNISSAANPSSPYGCRALSRNTSDSISSPLTDSSGGVDLLFPQKQQQQQQQRMGHRKNISIDALSPFDAPQSPSASSVSGVSDFSLPKSAASPGAAGASPGQGHSLGVTGMHKASASYFKRQMSPRATLYMEGKLYKKGRRFHHWVKRWYVLKKNCLYSYGSADDEHPKHATFLQGNFVEAEPDDKDLVDDNLFGIAIYDHSNRKRVLYAKGKQARDDWLDALRRGARSLPIKEYYSVGKQIGKGRFSTVHVGVEKATGIKFAIKVIDKALIAVHEVEKEALRLEIAVLRLVRHPIIVRIKDIFETRSRIFIVMSLMNAGDLFDRIVSLKFYPEDMARTVMWKLLSAVSYLHGLGIVHRDLKPENILCVDDDDPTEVVISDFGLSKFTTPGQMLQMPCGTLSYVAPEVLTRQGYSKAVDIWSLGVIMYLLLRGGLPFDGTSNKVIINKTLHNAISFAHERFNSVSEEGKDLIRKMLTKDPKKRVNVMQCIEHAWFDPIRDQSFKVSVPTQPIVVGNEVGDMEPAKIVSDDEDDEQQGVDDSDSDEEDEDEDEEDENTEDEGEVGRDDLRSNDGDGDDAVAAASASSAGVNQADGAGDGDGAPDDESFPPPDRTGAEMDNLSDSEEEE